MYTAPPGEETNDRETATDEPETPDEPTPEIDHEATATEANWTGNVAADD
ncbi:hypothetical protein [Halorussus marinus]|nr:hypothetical protein [Halorussus marinus]